MDKKNFNMKKIIKIGAPILVLLGILAVIVITQKPIEKISSELTIRPFDFNAYVDKYIEDSISGKPREQAFRGYEKIYGVISTEASIVATQGAEKDSLLSSSEADDCFERAFKAYYSIFERDADQLFASSIWNGLGGVKEGANDLMQRRGISTLESEKLKKYVKYVDGYNAAKKLISNSRTCKNGDSYDYYCRQADQYKGEPYKNNSDLNNIVNVVKNNAMSSWRNSIENYVHIVCGRSCNYYKSYNEFYNGDYTSAYNKINDYQKKFNIAWGEHLTSDLDNKNSQVYNCF